MTAAWALKAYACICALLLISYFLFAAIYRVSAALGLISSHRHWTRVAQALLILSILSPIAFHVVPARKLPVTDWNMFRPIEEGIALGKGTKIIKTRPIPTAVQTDRLAKTPVSSSNADWISRHPAGILLLLIFACVGLLGLRLWNESRRLRALLDDAALIRKIGHIRVVVTDAIKIPFSVRSRGDSWVVVPAFILERGKDLAVALRHELQHHRQKDTQWAMLIEVLRCALFPSPGIYLWKTKITELHELACDESLIGQKRVSLHDYGSCLVRVAEAALGDRSTYAGTTENGRYPYNGRVYHDWHKGGWDTLTTDETIANSSDICSMKIGEKIGPDGLVMMLEDFGFGPNGTAKDLPEARTGELPVAESHPDLVPYVVSGYYFNTTPIEMLQAYGAIANGGKLMSPKAANDPSEQVIRRALSPEASQEAKEVLRQVVLKGTAKRAQSQLYTTAGKTATAWTAGYINWMNGHYGDFAGFIGFAPVEKPRVEIYVGIKDPESKDGAHGSTHAAPVFMR